MVTTVFATKIGMSQAWTTAGKRMPVTKCRVQNNVVIGSQPGVDESAILEVGYGVKKLSNVKKPLRTKLEKNAFTTGITAISGIRVSSDVQTDELIGATLKVEDILQVGDIVKVQGVSKGRGFAGGIKRHGFSGGPKTHGQSDRERAVGSIGAGTSPGRVWKGKKMPGHYGVETHTVKNLTVVHIDPQAQEIWLSGPVPGAFQSIVRIDKKGEIADIHLDKKASGIVELKVHESSDVQASDQSQEEVAA